MVTASLSVPDNWLSNLDTLLVRWSHAFQALADKPQARAILLIPSTGHSRAGSLADVLPMTGLRYCNDRNSVLFSSHVPEHSLS